MVSVRRAFAPQSLPFVATDGGSEAPTQSKSKPDLPRVSAPSHPFRRIRSGTTARARPRERILPESTVGLIKASNNLNDFDYSGRLFAAFPRGRVPGEPASHRWRARAQAPDWRRVRTASTIRGVG